MHKTAVGRNQPMLVSPTRSRGASLHLFRCVVCCRTGIVHHYSVLCGLGLDHSLTGVLRAGLAWLGNAHLKWIYFAAVAGLKLDSGLSASTWTCTEILCKHLHRNSLRRKTGLGQDFWALS